MKVVPYTFANPVSVQKNFLSTNSKEHSSGIKSYTLVSFCANPLKNTAQTASIAPEYQGILNSVYKLGGLGNVAGEASVAFSEKGGMDFRTFIPYYAPDNESGGVKVRFPLMDGGKQLQWDIQTNAKDAQGNPVFQKIDAFGFKSVSPDYVLKDRESFVIHEDLQTSSQWKTGYKELEDTGIKGVVESISDDLKEIIKTPYKIFAVKETVKGDVKNPPVYVIHLPQLAKFQKAYGGVAYTGNSFYDAYYALFSRAAIDALPKMNNEQFGNFNPGNIWLHDRQAFPSLIEISDKSSAGDEYWKGVRAHSSYHNPGRNYQGHYKNPIDFMRIVGTSQDLEQLKTNPKDYKFAQDMIAKIEKERHKGLVFEVEDILTTNELNRLNEIFKPLYGEFIDETGEYNLCKIPVAGVRKNPFNFSAGTVSTNYGKEMKNHNTKEIAPGLTSDFASIPTVDIVNGSSAQNLHLDIIGDFGKNNGFTDEVKQGFTPLTEEVMSSPDKLFAAKQSNKKWLIDTIAKSTEKGKEALENLFFSEGAIKDGASVIGGFDKYKEGDVLFISWGRPESQKGFPTTLQGFLTYLKNPNIESAQKEHAKFLISAGPWKETEQDWKTIKKIINQIRTMDGGKYKNNICYINGFFTGRTVACADYANITSRYEPCGITPLESYAGGTPVISNNTGGSPDFIKSLEQGKKVTDETGFLTKNAYLVNPEVIGANPDIAAEALDEARMVALGKENASCIEQAVDLINNRPEEYKQMMSNAITAKIDWHENASFNGGLSALDKYKQCAWQINSANKELTGQARNVESLSSLKGVIKKKKETLDILSSTKCKYAAIAVAVSAVAIGGYAILIKKLKNEKPKQAEVEPKKSSLNVLSLNNFVSNNA